MYRVRIAALNTCWGGLTAQLSTNWGLAAALSEVFYADWPPDYLATLEENVHAVTPDRVRQVAIRTIGTDQRGLVVLGPKAVLTPELESLNLGDVVWRRW